MSGLEKITEKIRLDSEAECAKVKEQAERDAEKLLADARDRAIAAVMEIEAQTEKAVAEIAERGQSAAHSKQAQMLLAAKISAINSALDAAAQAVSDLAPKDYFAAIFALAVQNAEKGEGVMLLSPADKKRLPKGFTDKLNAALADKNASLTLGAPDKDIANGFILVYGDVEINCTFAAIFEDYRDELKEIVCGKIF